MKNLHDKKSISEQEFDEVSAKKKMAEANYEMALSKREQLKEKIEQVQEGVVSADVMKSYSEITAPFAGTVTNKMVEPGNLTAPGAPLLTIEQAGTYRLEAALEESRLPTVRVGQGVTVLSDPEAMVVSVRMVAVEVEAEAEAVVAEPEAGEPEVIGKEAEEQAEQEEK